jgi:subtilase family serine protease
MRSVGVRRIVTGVIAVVALCSGSVALGGAAAGAGASSRATIVGSHPSWASPAARVADANASDTMQFRVYLNLRERAGLDALAQAVSDPSSSTYRSYLSAGQVKARFAPTDASVASVKSWLAGEGLRPGYVPSNNQFVEATGSVSDVERAFGVHLGVYVVRGQHVRSPASDLSVPASLASTISGVIGVDQAFNLMRPDHVGVGTEVGRAGGPSAGAQTSGVRPTTVPPADGFRNGRPCGAYYGEQVDSTDPAFGGGFGKQLPYAPCGYKPQQLRQAYGTQSLLDLGLDGSRATVAVIDAFASPTIFEDASTYARRNDPGHPFKHSQFRQVVFPTNAALEGPDGCDAAGWYGEETLDIEAVHAMAPGAHIVYVGGSDCQDLSLDKALNEVISRSLAQIVSNSYGDLGEDIAPDEVAAFQDIAVQAVLQGIGVYFSSGDSGDEVADLGFPSPDFSASSQWVTAVGGTTLGIGANGQRLLETGWETGKSKLIDNVWTPPAPGAYVYGSGGGTSRLFSQPWYQRGVVPDALAVKNQAGGNKGRVVPDISMLGDPSTGMLVGQTQTFPEGVKYDEYRIGGTSLSSPLFAGVMALADDVLGVHHGFINPTIYKKLAGSPAITDVKHVKGAVVRVDYLNGVDDTDGTITSARSFDFGGLAIKTRPGYDDVTGLGVPNGMQFLFRV